MNRQTVQGLENDDDNLFFGENSKELKSQMKDNQQIKDDLVKKLAQLDETIKEQDTAYYKLEEGSKKLEQENRKQAENLLKEIQQKEAQLSANQGKSQESKQILEINDEISKYQLNIKKYQNEVQNIKASIKDIERSQKSIQENMVSIDKDIQQNRFKLKEEYVIKQNLNQKFQIKEIKLENKGRNKEKEEEERIKKEEEDKKLKDEEEKKRKEQEEQKRKEDEKNKSKKKVDKKKQEQERIKKEEEERIKKEEEERKKKEDEDKQKKDEELNKNKKIVDKKKEEQERIKKEEEEKIKKEEEEKKKKEDEKKQIQKKAQNLLVQIEDDKSIKDLLVQKTKLQEKFDEKQKQFQDKQAKLLQLNEDICKAKNDIKEREQQIEKLKAMNQVDDSSKKKAEQVNAKRQQYQNLLNNDDLRNKLKEEKLKLDNIKDQAKKLRAQILELEDQDKSLGFQQRMQQFIQTQLQIRQSKDDVILLKDYYQQLQLNVVQFFLKSRIIEMQILQQVEKKSMAESILGGIASVLPQGQAVCNLMIGVIRAREEMIQMNESQNFSHLVASSSDMDDIMKEVAFILTKVKQNMIMSLATQLEKGMIAKKIEAAKQMFIGSTPLFKGSDNGAKLMADIDSSIIIANCYSKAMCDDRIDDDPQDIDNKKGIRKLFIKCALLVNPTKYCDILNIQNVDNQTDLEISELKQEKYNFKEKDFIQIKNQIKESKKQIQSQKEFSQSKQSFIAKLCNTSKKVFN